MDIDFTKFCAELYLRPNFSVLNIQSKNQSILEKKESFTLELKSNLTKRFREIKKQKDSMLKLIPLSYDIILKPRLNENSPLIKQKTKSKNLNLNMRIKVAIKLFCNSSTDIILVSTKEFSNIDIR